MAVKTAGRDRAGGDSVDRSVGKARLHEAGPGRLVEIGVRPGNASFDRGLESGADELRRDLLPDLEGIDADRRSDRGDEPVRFGTPGSQVIDRESRGVRHESAPARVDGDHLVPRRARDQDRDAVRGPYTDESAREIAPGGIRLAGLGVVRRGDRHAVDLPRRRERRPRGDRLHESTDGVFERLLRRAQRTVARPAQVEGDGSGTDRGREPMGETVRLQER